jgi:hypothetical protein
MSVDVAAGHPGAAAGGASSHGEGDEGVAGEELCSSSKLIFGNVFVSPLYAGWSSHGDGADSCDADGFGASGVATIFFMSSMLIFGNALVSPLNASADGEAPNGESSFCDDEDDEDEDVAAGVDGRCISSKFIRGNARVSPLNAGG